MSSRVAEVEDVVRRIAGWAATRPDIAGVLLVGSWARHAATDDSDVDLVVLTTEPARYDGTGWSDALRPGRLVRRRSWGVLDEHRFVTARGLEVEINIGTPQWASIDPLDAGTRRVVSAGAVIVHDPHGLLDTLCRACAAGTAAADGDGDGDGAGPPA